jgi:serine/threonine protein kinase
MVRVGEYDLGEKIGCGTFSTVKLARHRNSGQQYVAKIVSRAQNNVDQDIRREIAILRRVRHDNIVRLIEILESPNNYYIILESVTGGDLCEHIIDNHEHGMPRSEVQRLFGQLVSGLATCHGVGVAHRDLKPENLLISKTDGQINLKISDFGLSRLHRHSQGEAQPHEFAETVTGTLAYLAPEVLRGKYDAFKADMWSMGCILYVMCTGRFPFGADTGPMLERRLLDGNIDPVPDRVPADARELITGLLQKNLDKRMTLPQVAAHPFLTNAATGEPDRYVLVDEDASPVHGPSPVQSSAGFHGADFTALDDAQSAMVSPLGRSSVQRRLAELRMGHDSDDEIDETAH